MKISKELLGWLLAAILFAGALGGLVYGLLNRTQPAPIEIIPALPTATPPPTATPGPLVVHVSGAVLAPDVYALPPASIVRDAVNMAGGFAPDAIREAVNLAQAVQNGMQIHVPAAGETVPMPPDRASGADPNLSGGLININRASQAELEQLPGIGPSLAQKIIAFRETHGSFSAINEITQVSGIGPAKFEQIKDLITVD